MSEQCFLAILHKSYEDNLHDLTCDGLRVLCELMSGDEKVKTYMQRMPGLTYEDRRYTDWIKPYLTERLAEH